MPQNKSAHIRYRAIDRYICNTMRPYPDKKFIVDKIYYDLGIDISESMIEKDIRQMKKDPPEGFSAPIEYHPTHKGYYYAERGFSINGLLVTEEEWGALRNASSLLFQYAELPMFRHFKEAIEKIDMRFGLGLDPSDSSIEKHIQ